MPPETLFLQPTGASPNPNPNFARATGVAVFSNYNQNPSGILTQVQAQTLVQGGVAVAIAEAAAIADFRNDPNFSLLIADSKGIALDGTYTGNSNIETKVVASFAVAANQSLSFNFGADVSLITKEIEDPGVEYNEAKAKSTFLVLDITDVNKPRVLDFFGIQGSLGSSKRDRDLKFSRSRNINFSSREKSIDINGNNGIDFIDAEAIGTYQRSFRTNTNIAIVETSASAVAFVGDNLIGNLGQDVIYGTIQNDRLNGTNRADKIYASFGDDRVDGKKGDDIIEGGQGNDRLDGEEGNDKINGGSGDDILIGGRGNDMLVGGDGYDQFVFRRGDSLFRGESDVIQDFQVGTDKIVFKGMVNTNAEQWLNQMFSLGHITNTNEGVLFQFDGGTNAGTLLVAGVNSNQINSQSIVFGQA